MNTDPILPPPFRGFGVYFDVLNPKPEAVALQDLVHHLPRIHVPSDWCEFDLTYGELTLRVVHLVERDTEAVRYALLMFAAEAYGLNFSRAQRRLLAAVAEGVGDEIDRRVQDVRRAARRAFGLPEKVPERIAGLLADAVETELRGIHRAVLLSDLRSGAIEMLDEALVRSELERRLLSVLRRATTGQCANARTQL